MSAGMSDWRVARPKPLSTLTVSVVRAFDLPPNASAFARVHLRCGPQSASQQTRCAEGPSPQWDQQLSFPIDDPTSASLDVSVYHRQRSGQVEFLGSSSLGLDQLKPGRPHSQAVVIEGKASFGAAAAAPPPKPRVFLIFHLSGPSSSAAPVASAPRAALQPCTPNSPTRALPVANPAAATTAPLLEAKVLAAKGLSPDPSLLEASRGLAVNLSLGPSSGSGSGWKVQTSAIPAADVPLWNQSFPIPVPAPPDRKSAG
eukprot:RCo045087